MERNKVYLIPFDWKSFAGNHTAMASYLAYKLKNDIYGIEVIPMYGPNNKILKLLNVLKAIYIAFILRFRLKDGDKVFLMEYLGKSSFHSLILRVMRLLGVKNEVYGMVHLAGSHLLELNTKETLLNHLKGIDHIVVLGSSLASFFKDELGFNNVITLFHYVDTDYYNSGNYTRKINDPLSVLVVGDTKRNFDKLKEIVWRLPNVNFRICQGFKNLRPLFEGLSNVTLYGYLEEKELIALMQESDVSLSVMDDTIGSNVITSSLTTGLISVASDVGSIRDYLSENESFLCKSTDEFVSAIDYLDNNKTLLPELKMKSLARGELFSYPNFAKAFAEVFNAQLITK